MNYYNYPQMYSNGIIPVPNEQTVENYPVAPGNCVTFKVEGKPIVMEKSMGFSQFEQPRIEKYRLIKEGAESRDYSKDDNSSMEELKSEIRALWSEIDALKERGTKNERKRYNDRNNTVEE